jgi:hypothetical protein
MKLHLDGTANRRMSKDGFALLSLLYKIDRIPSFDIHYSTFDIRFLGVSIFDQTGHYGCQRRR